MDSLSEIKKHIEEMAGRKGFVSFTAKVVDVSGETCTAAVDDLSLSDIRLRSVVNAENSKMLVTPKIGSYVTVLDTSNGNLTDLVVVAVSEVEKIEIDTNGTVIFNGGGNNGLVKIEDLHNRLKALEKAFNNHTHTITVIGAVPASPATPPSATELPPTASNQFQGDFSGYEDSKIKH